ncbi:hypothetical protein DID80_02660 [Candidatus Marinamargulisbacteria bacterium SCGC AAA071-K20]|nr:hypothetical protein DID80_02660 [Candidatus Marinamargulisbacteria bacterium SCGC AAA071-K20]
MTLAGIKTGSSDIEQIQSGNYGSIMINLHPFSTRDRTAKQISDEILKSTTHITGYEELDIRIDGGGPPVGKDIEIRIINTTDSIREKAEQKIISTLKNIEGAESIKTTNLPGKPQIKLQIKEEKLARLGLTLSQVVQTISTAYKGSDITSTRIKNEDVGFHVILNDEDRKNINTLKTLLIPNNTQKLIPLKEVVNFYQIPGSPNYYHYNGLRSTTITAGVNKDISTPIKVYETLKKALPESLIETQFQNSTIVYGGEAQETNESFISLFQTLLLALLGIYFTLILLFNSLSQPFIVILTIPFGMIGVITAFGLHNQDLGFMSMLGTIGLTGIIVNDALILVNHINNLRKEMPETPLLQLVAKGTADRFRALLLTTLTTVAGILPLAYGIGGSDPFIAPMGLALGYGLAFSTPVIMILVPSFYLLIEDIKSIPSRLRKKKPNEH